MTNQSYQYGRLPTVQNNNDTGNINNNSNTSSGSYNNGRDQNIHSGGQDFQSFQRGLEEMYKSPGPGEGNYGRWNIYMVGCIFIAFLLLLSGTNSNRSAIIHSKENHNSHSNNNNNNNNNNINRSYHNGQEVPNPSTQEFGRPTPTPTSQNQSKYSPKTAPAVPLPSPPISTSANIKDPSIRPPTTDKKKINMLMAFPMSGVSYTFHLLSSLTDELTLGTNYALTEKQEPMLEESYPNGPFLYSMNGNNLDAANTFLVMTHCGSHCPDVNDCGGHEEETIWSFDTECRVTTKYVPHVADVSLNLYDRSLVDYSKTIHLLRDPLANLVSLFHLQHYYDNESFSKKYPNTKDGYHNWCKDQTTPPEDWWILGDYLMKDHLQKIPCFFQLFQYIQWHMLTYQLHRGQGHIIRFEDFDNGNNLKAGTSALQFLNVPIKNSPNAPYFRGAKMYHDYYSTEQTHTMWELIKTLSPEPLYTDAFQFYEPKK